MSYPLIVVKATCALGAALLLLASTPAAAETDTLMTSDIRAYTDGMTSYATLSNEDLLIRADQLRTTRISPHQRIMNYQWLSEQSGQSDTVEGGNAISRLIERHLKAYLKDTDSSKKLKETLMPEGNGNGFIKGVDYDVKLRANKFVIGVSYEF